MTLIGDIFRVALPDMYYLRRNILVLLATSIVTPLLYLVAFGYGLGNGITMEADGETFEYIAYMVPGVVALTTVTSSFTTVSNKLMIQKRFYESFDEMLLCPITKTSLVLGKSVLGIVKSALCGSIMLALGCCLSGDMHITAGLIGCMLLSCMTFSLLGVAAGMIIPDLPSMNLFNSFVILPMTFLCGTMFSIDSLPDAAADIIWCLPLTHTSECLRACALGLDFPWISLAVLIAYAVAFYLLGMFALRKSE
ncbi:MAG: ABC transporter permease [Candidatus Methanomethylophilus sp.]|jgi:ABC-type multidrug transport system permease subunit|nr:ABC transporter permease [Methanomethylophilus sp.]MCI2074509.1 ABC transporter permease [Methanomethylophilus sp.]MCI2093778.1 ABC transporter permease [Methanomethylophilus sp.]MCI2093809.1 ABC transporter permease [Methanomethylophilus sp.]